MFLSLVRLLVEKNSSEKGVFNIIHSVSTFKLRFVALHCTLSYTVSLKVITADSRLALAEVVVVCTW